MKSQKRQRFIKYKVGNEFEWADYGKDEFMTFLNRNMKYEHFIMFDEIMKFDNKMNMRAIEETLTLMTSIGYNSCHQYII